MQKKLIAVAVAGLVSGAAFAQSNVTIYGVAHATYDNVQAGSARDDGDSLSRRGRTTFNSSYIGFKGAESLGNGLTAVFQFETGVGENASGSFGSLTGMSSANTITGSTYGWANRDTMVAIAGGFGTLAFGNLTGPTRLLGSVMDPNAGATGIGANTALLGKMGGGAGAGVFDQRIANAIAYISPTFGGFYGVIGYLPNENRGSDASEVAAAAATASQCAAGGVVSAVAGPCPAGSTTISTNSVAHLGQTDISAWTFGGVYANGPILAGLTYTKAKESGDQGIAYANNTLKDLTTLPVLYLESTSDVRAAFKYDFGVASVGIMWDRMKADIMSWQGGGEAKQDVWYIPVTVKLGNGKLIGQYGRANKVKLDDNDLDETGAKHFVIGYEYNLSKRTMVKALWSQINNDDNASYDFLYGVSQPNSTGYSLAGAPLGSSPKGLSVGIRHSF